MTDTGNISTIATTIWVSIIAPILLYFGVTIDQTLGIGVLTGILTVIFMIWNAKNPNSFKCLGNAPALVTSEEPILNDEYILPDEEGNEDG